MPELREKRVELILQQLEDLPALPQVVISLLQGDGDTVAIVAADAALSARVLQLLGAPTLQDAAQTLGIDAIRYAVLAVTVYQTFAQLESAEKEKSSVASSPFNADEFWK